MGWRHPWQQVCPDAPQARQGCWPGPLCCQRCQALSVLFLRNNSKLLGTVIGRTRRKRRVITLYTWAHVLWSMLIVYAMHLVFLCYRSHLAFCVLLVAGLAVYQLLWKVIELCRVCGSSDRAKKHTKNAELWKDPLPLPRGDRDMVYVDVVIFTIHRGEHVQAIRLTNLCENHRRREVYPRGDHWMFFFLVRSVVLVFFLRIYFVLGRLSCPRDS